MGKGSLRRPPLIPPDEEVEAWNKIYRTKQRQFELMAQFIHWTMFQADVWCDDVYGADIQDKAEELGIIKMVKKTVPCDGRCMCAEIFDEGEQVDCFLVEDWLLKAAK